MPEYNTNWDNYTDQNQNTNNINKKTKPFWFMLCAFVCFVFMIILLGYNYYTKNNSISSDNIIITHNLKSSYESGITNNLEFNIKNNNKVEIKDVIVYIEYESGRKQNGEYSIVRENFKLGDIYFGQNISSSTNILFTGKEGDTRNISINIDYHLKNNTIFSKNISENIVLGSSLININIVSNKKEFVIGDYAEITTTIKNVSKNIWNGGYLDIQVPYGFVSESDTGAITKASDFKNIYIKPLNVGDTYQYKILGYFDGKNIGENIFRYSVIDKSDNKSLITEDLISLQTIANPILYRFEFKKDSETVNQIKSNQIYNVSFFIKNNSDIAYDNLYIRLDSNFAGAFVFDSAKLNSLLRLLPGEEQELNLDLNFPQGKNEINIEVYGNKKGDTQKTLLLSQNKIFNI